MSLLHCCPFLPSMLSIFLRHLCSFHCCLFPTHFCPFPLLLLTFPLLSIPVFCHCCPIPISLLPVSYVIAVNFFVSLLSISCFIDVYIHPTAVHLLYHYCPFPRLSLPVFCHYFPFPLSLLPVSYFIAIHFFCHCCPFPVSMVSIFIPLLSASYITTAHLLNYCRFSAIAVHFLCHCCQFPILSLLFSNKVLWTNTALDC